MLLNQFATHHHTTEVIQTNIGLFHTIIYNTVSMYTNIDPTEGIDMVSKFLHFFTNKYFSTSVHNTMIDLLNLVIPNYIFKSDITWQLQNIGTAMEFPVAFIYAIIFFGYYKDTKTLRIFKKSLLFYDQQIDDVLGIEWMTHKSLLIGKNFN